MKDLSKLTKLTVTASRTLQVVQYEPLSVTLTEEHEIGKGFHELTSKKQEAYKRQLTERLSKLLDKTMQDVVEHYRD